MQLVSLVPFFLETNQQSLTVNVETQIYTWILVVASECVGVEAW